MLIVQRILSHPIFTYYCSNCYTILYQTKVMLTSGYLSQKLIKCPECNQLLQDTLTYIQNYNINVKPQNTSMQNWPKQEIPPKPVFQSAASLLGLTTGISRIDSILGGLMEKTHLLILGSLSKILAERLCLRSLLPREYGGLETNPIFIDAGNCSDPYLYAFFARRYQIESRKALQRVLTSRVFTTHQLVNIILKEIPHVVKQYKTKLIILAEALSMFNDPHIDQLESERIVQEIGYSIQKILDEDRLVIVSTTTEKNKLSELLLKQADAALEINSMRYSTATVTLLKHPKQKTSTINLHQKDLFRVTMPQ